MGIVDSGQHIVDGDSGDTRQTTQQRDWRYSPQQGRIIFLCQQSVPLNLIIYKMFLLHVHRYWGIQNSTTPASTCCTFQGKSFPPPSLRISWDSMDSMGRRLLFLASSRFACSVENGWLVGWLTPWTVPRMTVPPPLALKQQVKRKRRMNRTIRRKAGSSCGIIPEALFIITARRARVTLLYSASILTGSTQIKLAF